MSNKLAVVLFCFKNHKELSVSGKGAKKHCAECTFCSKIISETCGTLVVVACACSWMRGGIWLCVRSGTSLLSSSWHFYGGFPMTAISSLIIVETLSVGWYLLRTYLAARHCTAAILSIFDFV